jgi:hypothetical protein
MTSPVVPSLPITLIPVVRIQLHHECFHPVKISVDILGYTQITKVPRGTVVGLGQGPIVASDIPGVSAVALYLAMEVASTIFQ